jgi:hypothetical protein
VKTITGATFATPIVVTTATAHGFLSGQSVTVVAVGGNTNANGTWVVTVLSTTTFSLNGSSGNAAYTAGGRCNITGLANPILSLVGNELVGNINDPGFVQVVVNITWTAWANRFGAAATANYNRHSNGTTEQFGAGSPAAVVVATPGSRYVASNGGANLSFWVKESASDATGWVAK